MTVLVYHDPGTKSWEEAPDLSIEEDAGAVVLVDTTTPCGTDLHILNGDPRGDRGADAPPPGGRPGRAGHRRGDGALARRLDARVVPLGVWPVPFLSRGPLRAARWTWALTRWVFRHPRGSAQSRRPERRACGRGPTA